jgi:L-rhamnose mutarotase
MKRYGSIIELRPERADEYKDLHANVWPEVLSMIKACNIHNYSIFLRDLPDGRLYLFSYFEYSGDDYNTDMQKMADDPMTQKWWDVCKPCHVPLDNRADGGWWASMEEVFHCE